MSNYSPNRKKIRRVLTGSRVDSMLLMYTIIANEFDKNDTDVLEFDTLFKEIMKQSRGALNPYMIKEELERI